MYEYDGYDTYEGYYKQAKRIIRKYAYGYVGVKFLKNIDVIEEIVSVMMKADWKYDPIKYPNCKKSSFRINCARNRLYTLIKNYKKKYTSKSLINDYSAATANLDRSIDIKTLVNMSELTELERTAILAYYLEMQTYKEMVENTGIHISKLRRCISNGLNKIRLKHGEYNNAA